LAFYLLILTVIGFEFEECYVFKAHITVQGTEIDFINLENLK